MPPCDGAGYGVAFCMLGVVEKEKQVIKESYSLFGGWNKKKFYTFVYQTNT